MVKQHKKNMKISVSYLRKAKRGDGGQFSNSIYVEQSASFLYAVHPLLLFLVESMAGNNPLKKSPPLKLFHPLSVTTLTTLS